MNLAGDSHPHPDLHRIALQAMQARGLRSGFAPEALQEAEAAAAVVPAAGGEVRDQRGLCWFSIDNADTRDLDQLSVAEPLADGRSRLRVAVADVDVLVARGSAVDAHAAANTTSVYTAAGVFPMLPEQLSTDLSSLHEGRQRLAVVVDMQVAADGEVLDAAIYRALVLNRAKLSYDTVAAWLDGRGPAPAHLAQVEGLEEQLRLHDRIAIALGDWRDRRGALDVKTVSARPVFDPQGRLLDLRPDDRNRAKDLIAELMIATNSAVARFLARQGFPSLRRFLQSPRRWDRLQDLVAQHGGVLPATPDAQALHAFLRERRAADPQGFSDLSLKVVKMLGPGTYMAAPPDATGLGHFGLAVSDYAHSTAPNRRFTDLVTQRLLKAALAGRPPPYGLQALEAIARQCTLQEDNAGKVERQVLKAAAAVLLQGRIGEAFDAIVTGAAPKGTFVRIASPLLEGRLVQGTAGVDVGDALRVRLLAVDAEQGFIDFARADGPGAGPGV